MKAKSKNMQQQYQGYLSTPLLWKRELLGLKQLELLNLPTASFNNNFSDDLRLGKRVERFVNAELKQHDNIKILTENVQIQNHKRTIGELDCLLVMDNIPIHLEIVYKFYLFDGQVGSTEIEHWIGPNRKDNLLNKLQKLRHKQLPLLYNQNTKHLLKDLNLNSDNIIQRVYFKAQLFVPFNNPDIDFGILNKDCVQGFYIHIAKIMQFNACKFYIPCKTDWLIEVGIYVKWLNYTPFYEKIMPLINIKTAPLCWIKFPNGTVKKFFVVWWA